MSYGGLDVGTTSVKFAIYTEDGTLLSLSQSVYGNNRQSNPNRISGSAVWKAVKHVISDAVQKCTGRDPLKAFSISSFGEAAIPIDRDGNELGNTFLYTAPEGKEELSWILERIDAGKVQQITGIKPSVIFPLVRINWCKNHESYFSKVWKFLQFEDYVIYRMTGETIISLSLASRTMALDLEKGEWSDYVLDGCEVDPDLFSTPVPSGTFAGTVHAELAAELGLPIGVKVYTGGHDQMCGMIGAGAAAPHKAANASGTVECISAVLPEGFSKQVLLQNNTYVSAYTDPGSFFTFVGTPAGCAILDWYMSLFLGKERKTQDFKSIEANCSGHPSPVQVIPFMAGRGVPNRDINATGTFKGLRLTTTSSEIFQAIMESLAFEMRLVIDIYAQAGIPIDNIYATGGGAGSDLWMQLKADIYQRPVARMRSIQLVAFGCAMIAGVADGAFSNLNDAVLESVKFDRVFYPDGANARLFEEKYAFYKEMRNF